MAVMSFAEIAEKCRNGIRINEEEALALFEHPDILELGSLADDVNRMRNRDMVFYNINRHINPTNVCAKSCKFCAFSRKPGEEGAYEYTIEEILQRADQAQKEGATEVHMVGGLHPRWPFKKFLEIISAVKTHYPNLHVKAFTAVEIDWLAARARMNVRDTLLALKEAGLDSIPGGGAEIFHPEVREKICDTKTDGERWIEIHRTAHSIGMRSNCTMLYGHIEKPYHRIDHMRRLRDLQDETHGFNVFIPLAFQPHDNEMGITRYTAGMDDLRTIAVARLYLDNFKNIKAYWIMLGQDIAQMALHFGANDVDGTVTEEKISRMAGGRSGMAMSRSQIEAIIHKAERRFVERDTLYKPVRPAEMEGISGVPVSAEEERLVSMLLYKAEKGEQLTYEEGLALANAKGNFFSLGQCARVIKQRMNDDANGVGLGIWAAGGPKKKAGAQLSDDQPSVGVDLSQAILVLDLSADNEMQSCATVGELCDFVVTAKMQNPQRHITITGLKGLWSLARRYELTVDALLVALKQSGVETIESSSNESEADLTLKEVIALHRSCHNAHIMTVGKVEVMAAYSGKEMPFWDDLVKRTLEFRKLQEETGGVLALKVEAAKDSFVTPYEYLRALALTRVLGDNIKHVLAPFAKIPLIKPRGDHRVAAANDPALKLAPLTLHFGASDLGVLVSERSDPFSLMDELKLSGLALNFRDSGFEPVNML